MTLTCFRKIVQNKGNPRKLLKKRQKIDNFEKWRLFFAPRTMDVVAKVAALTNFCAQAPGRPRAYTRVPGPGFGGATFFNRKRGTFLGPFWEPSLLATGPTEIPGCPLLVPNVDPLLTHLWPKFGAKGGPTFDSPFAADFSKKEERTEVPVYRPIAASTLQGPQGGTRDPTGKKHTKNQ